MPATIWKILNKNSPGTSSTFGADDWDMPGRYHNDVDLTATAPSSIKTNTSFWDNRLRVWNPAKTKSYRIRGLAILNDYDVILPLLTANDEVTMNLATQEVQNKTYNVNLNTLRNTSNSIGQLLVGNGTKYLPLNMGGSAGHVLTINSGVNGLEWAAPAAGGGGANDEVIVREAGVQVGSAARKLNFATASNFAITEDVPNDEIDISLASNAITDSLISTHTTTKISTTSKSLLHSGIVYNDLTEPNIGQLAWLNTRHASEHCGQFSGVCVSTGTFSADSVASGPFGTYTTGAVSGNQAGFRTNVNMMERGHTPAPKIVGRFALEHTTLQRVFIGWVSDNAGFLSGADPLNAKSGFGLWIDLAVSANIRKIRNDGAGASTQSDYDVAIAPGTSFHDFEIVANDAAAAFTLSVDGAAIDTVTGADIPASTTEMAFQAYTETTSAASRALRLGKLIVTLGTI